MNLRASKCMRVWSYLAWQQIQIRIKKSPTTLNAKYTSHRSSWSLFMLLFTQNNRSARKSYSSEWCHWVTEHSRKKCGSKKRASARECVYDYSSFYCKLSFDYFYIRYAFFSYRLLSRLLKIERNTITVSKSGVWESLKYIFWTFLFFNTHYIASTVL